jgi:hypothetical protein
MRTLKHYWQEKMRDVTIRNDDMAIIQLIILWLLNISLLCIAFMQ